MAQKFTIDTNCLIALEKGEAASKFIRDLAEAHAAGKAHVAVVAISASEKPKDGIQPKNFSMFQDRLATIGLSHLEILRPMMYFDVTFFDWCLWSDKKMQLLEKKIHDVLFSNLDFVWADCEKKLAPSEDANDMFIKWRNAKCDVQAIWSHINYGRDIFVTSDGNFHAATKRPALVALGAGRIETPDSAITLI